MITSLEGLCRNSMWLGDPDLINLVKSRNFEYFKDRIQIPELSTKGGDTRITITMNRFVRNKVGIGWFCAVQPRIFYYRLKQCLLPILSITQIPNSQNPIISNTRFLLENREFLTPEMRELLVLIRILISLEISWGVFDWAKIFHRHLKFTENQFLLRFFCECGFSWIFFRPWIYFPWKNKNLRTKNPQ